MFHKLCLVLAVEQVCVDNLKMRPQLKSPRSCGFFEKTVRTRLTDSNPHRRRGIRQEIQRYLQGNSLRKHEYPERVVQPNLETIPDTYLPPS